MKGAIGFRILDFGFTRQVSLASCLAGLPPPVADAGDFAKPSASEEYAI